MWEFLYRLIAISLPNIRDFRGVRAKLDGKGNYSLGVTDHSIFPEINVERQRVNVGLDICITTTANNDEEGMELTSTSRYAFSKAISTTRRTGCLIYKLITMAKKSAIQRNLKRVKMVARYSAKRDALKKILSDPNTSEEDFYAAQAKANQTSQKLISSSLGQSLFAYRKTSCML